MWQYLINEQNSTSKRPPKWGSHDGEFSTPSGHHTDLIVFCPANVRNTTKCLNMQLTDISYNQRTMCSMSLWGNFQTCHRHLQLFSQQILTKKITGCCVEGRGICTSGGVLACIGILSSSSNFRTTQDIKKCVELNVWVKTLTNTDMEPGAYIPNTLETEVRGSLVSGVPKLHGVFKDSLGYKAWCCLKIQIKWQGMSGLVLSF
jgi:hypothetical protein